MAVTLSSLAGAGAQFFDNNGVPLAGGLIYTYTAGTTTPAATYTSSTGLTAHANPIVLDAAGRIAIGEVWLTTGVDYKFLVKTSTNVQLGSYDNIPSINDFTTINAEFAELANTSNVALGDALIGFKQSNSGGALNGAVGRTVHQKLQESVSVKDFGATGDGTTDDTTAISTALTAAISAQVPLYFPAGTYVLSNQIAVTSAKSIKIYGAGIDLTTLVWTTAATSGGGLSITYTDVEFPPTIQDLSLHTRASIVGTALSITGTNSASVTRLGAIVSNISIQGENTATQCWDIGINFILCWYSTTCLISIKGKDEAVLPFSMTTGIKLTSCQVAMIDRFVIFHTTYAVQNAITSGITRDEGHAFSNFELVGVQVGFDLTNQANAAGTNIGPGHINSYQYGLNLANRYQTSIHDLLLYKTNLSTSDYTGINLINCDANIIHDNDFNGASAATGAMYGIVITTTTAGNRNNIHDNTFQSFYGTGLVGIVMGLGASKTLIHHNICDSTLAAIIVIDPTSAKDNVFYSNLPSSIQQLTVNSTTPSVGNDLSGQWFEASTVPTTITNFVDGYQTQVITIVSTTSNTTIQSNAGLVLKGGANFAMAINNVLTLQRESNLWREISRSV